MKSFYSHSGGLEGQGCMIKKKLWQKLMWRLQPNAAKMEVWSHPWAVSLNFPVTMETNFSSLGFQRRKVSGRGRKRLNESNWEREWTGALQEDSSAQGNFYRRRSLGSLPPSQCKGTVQCLLSSHCDTTVDCQQTTFLFGSICFASVDFSD